MSHGKILGYSVQELDKITCRLTYEGAIRLGACNGVFDDWHPDTIYTTAQIMELFSRFNIAGFLVSVFNKRCYSALTENILYLHESLSPSMKSYEIQGWGIVHAKRLNKLNSGSGWATGSFITSHYTPHDTQFIERCLKAVILKACEKRDAAD